MKSFSKVATALFGLIGSVYFVVFHWGRFLQDFYPLDSSRVSPNIVASAVQYVVLGILAYLLYPPVRKAVDKWLKSHLRNESAVLHAKLDHIIEHHPDIPPFSAGAKPSQSPGTPPPTSPGVSKTEAPSSPESQPR